MTIPPDDTRLTRITPCYGIWPDRAGDQARGDGAGRRAPGDTDGVVKTAFKELSAVIHFLETHRF
jgi:hypothetical protein